VTPEETLAAYLHRARDALIWKLEGLDDYDVRRPLTATGTNLLGLIKHTALVSADYLGDIFGRPFEHPMTAAIGEGAAPNDDMWAPADEFRQDVVDLWDAAWMHIDATLAAVELDASGEVPWWPPERNPVTLHQVIVHVLAELHRHAGHADIVRELIDGAAGASPAFGNLPDVDLTWWSDYVERVEAAARTAADR